MSTIVVTCRQMQAELPRYVTELLASGHRLVVPPLHGQQLDEDELIDVLADADGIIAGDEPLTARVIGAAPKLRVISRWGVGTDAVDREAARARGIHVVNTPGVFGDEVADVALGYVLMLARRLHQVDAAVRAGRWYQPEGVSLRGRVAGIVGLGSVGQPLARRLAVLGMSVLGVDPSPSAVEKAVGCGVKAVTFADLLEGADVVVLCVPLTMQTHGIMNATSIRALRTGSWLINVSRGRVIDQSALVEALEDGHLGGAALDVFETEPLPVDSPLTRMDNVVLGSHNASNTREAVERASRWALENLLDHLDRR